MKSEPMTPFLFVLHIQFPAINPSRSALLFHNTSLRRLELAKGEGKESQQLSSALWGKEVKHAGH